MAKVEDHHWWNDIYGSLSAGLSSQTDTGGIADNRFRLHTWRATIGRRWGLRTRMELEVSRHSSRHVSELETPVRHSQSFQDGAFSTSLNAHRTLARRGQFTLRTGGGVGFERSKQTQKLNYPDFDYSLSTSSRYERFRYNLSVGASYQLTPRVSIQLSYRVDKTTGKRVNRTLNTLNLALSLASSPRKSAPD